jgi:hypothetical protein
LSFFGRFQAAQDEPSNDLINQAAIAMHPAYKGIKTTLYAFFEARQRSLL